MLKGQSVFLWVLCLLALLPERSDAASLKTITQNYLRPAIVKLDVSYSGSKVVDGRETCSSEGTGFIVSDRHIVTAKHVFETVAECGTPLIIARSKYTRDQWHLNVLKTNDDVALLVTDDGVKMDLSIAKGRNVYPCAAIVSPVDVYDVEASEAIRYGIEAGHEEANPVWVAIDSEDGEFAPRVRITPHALVSGESGGPVVSAFRVVGVIRQRVAGSQTIGLMTPVSFLNPLLSEFDISPADEDQCNTQAFAGTLDVKVQKTAMDTVTISVELGTHSFLESSDGAVAKDIIIQEIQSVVGGKGTYYLTETESGLEFTVIFPDGSPSVTSEAFAASWRDVLTSKNFESVFDDKFAAKVEEKYRVPENMLKGGAWDINPMNQPYVYVPLEPLPELRPFDKYTIPDDLTTPGAAYERYKTPEELKFKQDLNISPQDFNAKRFTLPDELKNKPAFELRPGG